MNAIEVQNLCKTYKKPRVEALCGVSFRVQRGTCFGILGPNGAGKSTLLEIVQGLMPFSSGEVKILGMDYRSSGARIREKISGILQHNALYEKSTAREAVELFASFHRCPRRVPEILEELNLTSLAPRRLVHLSGGQRQRVYLATALVGNPEVVFLDEPTTGLDPASREDLWKILKAQRAQGRTIVLSTHDMAEAETLCDALVVMHEGRIIACGSPADLVAAWTPKLRLRQQVTLNDVFLALAGKGVP